MCGFLHLRSAYLIPPVFWDREGINDDAEGIGKDHQTDGRHLKGKRQGCMLHAQGPALIRTLTITKVPNHPERRASARVADHGSVPKSTTCHARNICVNPT
jgi:hypothetical protein